jgi:hypothetical protein
MSGSDEMNKEIRKAFQRNQINVEGEMPKPAETPKPKEEPRHDYDDRHEDKDIGKLGQGVPRG